MKKILISVLILALLSNLTCFAANTVRGTYNEDTKEVLVEGYLDDYKNAPAAVWILKEGKENLDGLTKANINDYLLHLEQVVTNEDGDFDFTYTVKNEGVYNTFVKSFDASLIADGMIIARGSGYYLELIEKIEKLRDPENNDLNTRISSLKDIITKKGVYDALKIYQSDMPEGVSLENVSDSAYSILLGYSNKYPTEEGKFAKIFIDSVVVDILNNASKNEIADKFDDLKAFLPKGYDLILKEYIELGNSTDETKKASFAAISKTLADDTFKTLDDANLALCEQVSITSLKAMDNYSEFMRFVNKVENQMGLDLEKYETIVSPRDPENVDKAIVRNKASINSLKELRELFAKECDIELERELSSTSSGSSSSSKGSSKGSGGSVSGFVGTPIVPEISPDEIEDAPSQFRDLNQKHWAYIPVANLAKRGIINGYSNSTFAPNNNVKREEIIKMLIVAFDACDMNATSDFNDASETEWYYPYVSTAFSKGYVKGMSDTSFGIGQYVSRQDSAVMIYNVITKLGRILPSKRVYESFADESDISSYAQDAVKALYTAQVIDGTGTGFNPNGNLTRAEAAKIIYGVLKIVKG